MTALYIIFALTLACVIALHILSVMSKEGTRVFAYSNVALHIALIAEQLFLGFSLEILSLVMMSSLLLYLLLSFIKIQKDKKAREVEK